jgi:hypothetical protein
MGFFKQMKDMKDMVAAAPDMVEQANQMQANAEAMAAAQQAAAAQAMAQVNATSAAAVAPAGGPDFEPVAGVDLKLYAEIAKGLAAYNYDQSAGPAVAATKGVSADAWEAAVTEWNLRMQRNPAVAKAFNTYYTSGV